MCNVLRWIERRECSFQSEEFDGGVHVVLVLTLNSGWSELSQLASGTLRVNSLPPSIQNQSHPERHQQQRCVIVRSVSASGRRFLDIIATKGIDFLCDQFESHA